MRVGSLYASRTALLAGLVLVLVVWLARSKRGATISPPFFLPRLQRAEPSA